MLLKAASVRKPPACVISGPLGETINQLAVCAQAKASAALSVRRLQTSPGLTTVLTALAEMRAARVNALAHSPNTFLDIVF